MLLDSVLFAHCILTNKFRSIQLHITLQNMWLISFWTKIAGIVSLRINIVQRTELLELQYWSFCGHTKMKTHRYIAFSLTWHKLYGSYYNGISLASALPKIFKFRELSKIQNDFYIIMYGTDNKLRSLQRSAFRSLQDPGEFDEHFRRSIKNILLQN